MDRPDWCPQDVWTKAVGCCMEMQVRDMNTGCVIDAEIHVARAILAAKAEEREEIADIGDAMACLFDGHAMRASGEYEIFEARSAEYAVKEFTKAIRKRGEG